MIESIGLSSSTFSLRNSVSNVFLAIVSWGNLVEGDSLAAFKASSRFGSLIVGPGSSILRHFADDRPQIVKSFRF